MIRALDLLYHLGAIDGEGNLTEGGSMIATFPLDPPLAKMLIMASQKYHCGDEILSLVSLLSVPPVFIRPFASKDKAEQAHEKFKHPDVDHLTLINVFGEFSKQPDKDSDRFFWCRNNFLRFQSLNQAQNVKEQLTKIMDKLQLPYISLSKDSLDYSVNIRKCILEGCFPQVVAKFGRSGTFVCVKDGTKHISIHPTSGALKTSSEWVVYQEFVRTYKKFVRTVSPIDPEWLSEIASHYYDEKELTSEYFTATFSQKPKKKAKVEESDVIEVIEELEIVEVVEEEIVEIVVEEDAESN